MSDIVIILTLIYGIGGAVCGLICLTLIARDFGHYARTSGLVSEILHYGSRLALLTVLWPSILLVFVGVMIENHRTATGTNGNTGRTDIES